MRSLGASLPPHFGARPRRTSRTQPTRRAIARYAGAHAQSGSWKIRCPTARTATRVGRSGRENAKERGNRERRGQALDRELSAARAVVEATRGTVRVADSAYRYTASGSARDDRMLVIQEWRHGDHRSAIPANRLRDLHSRGLKSNRSDVAGCGKQAGVSSAPVDVLVPPGELARLTQGLDRALHEPRVLSCGPYPPRKR